VLAGQPVGFAVGAGGSPAPTCQWQESTNSGSTWSNLTDGNGIKGSATGFLSIESAPVSLSGAQFRAVETNSAGSATSTPVTLTVTSLPGGVVAAYDFITEAGAGPGSENGPGATAQFHSPGGVVSDGNGNVYVADTENEEIRRIDSSGNVSTFAGSALNWGASDGTGSAAQFAGPSDIAIDSAGNLYVADSGSNSVRKITPSAVVTTLAGLPAESGLIIGAAPSGDADGTGSTASFNLPTGVAVDSSGNVYVADTSNCSIRKITPAGVVTTLAGSRQSAGSADGTGSAASFNGPTGVAVDASGNVYVADQQNDTIRKVTPSGVVTTLAGAAGEPGYADGTGSAARFNLPSRVAVDAAGNLFVPDTNNGVIREITPAGVVTTVVLGSQPVFDRPGGISIGSSGTIYVTDTGDGLIRSVTLPSTVTTLAGGGSSPGSTDGAAADMRFSQPEELAADVAGNVYVCDVSNNTIRRITAAGVGSTLAGDPGIAGSADGTGSAARFSGPAGVAADTLGNVYVADSGNQTIRKIAPGGIVTTLAGLAGVAGGANGTGSQGLFYAPNHLAIDQSGNLYTIDYFGVRKITPQGVVTTVVEDTSLPELPEGVSVDASGNLYLSTAYSGTIVKVSPTGTQTILAGSSQRGDSDGTGSAASFGSPEDLAGDTAGNLFVIDYGNSQVRKVSPAGVVTTIGGGQNSMAGTSDGIGSAATFSELGGVAVDQVGNVYVTDLVNNKVIRASVLAATPLSLTSQPQDLVVNAGQNATFQVGASGTGPISYQWQVRPLGASSWSSLSDGGAYSGSASAALQVTAATVALNGAQFQCVVTGPLATATSNTAQFTVEGAPAIATGPASQTQAAGGEVTFSVAPEGYPLPTFQWQFDGTNIAGATDATLTLPDVQASNAGTYDVVVTNADGSVTSGGAALTVTPAAPYSPTQAVYSVDPTFTPAIPGIPQAVAAQSDGKVLVAEPATFTSGSYSQYGLVRLDTNGSLDTTYVTYPNPFTNSGGSSFEAIDLQSDGSALVIYSEDQLAAGASADITSTGAWNPSYVNPSSGGVTLTGGDSLNLGIFNNTLTVTIFNPDQTVANSYPVVLASNSQGAAGPKYTSVITAALPSGQILVAATSFVSIGTAVFYRNETVLLRLLPDGSLDPSFPMVDLTGDNVWGDAVVALFPDSSGTHIYTESRGSFLGGSSQVQFNRLNSDGSADPTYTPVTVLTYANTVQEPLSTFVLNSDGSFLLLAPPQTPGTTYAINQYDTNGVQDPSFSLQLVSADFTKTDYLQPIVGFDQEQNGDILVWGNFSTLNGVALPGLARLVPSTVVSASSQTAGAGSSLTLSASTALANATYQWQLNGAAIPGATSPTLALPNIGTTQAGAYTAVITSGTTTFTTQPADVSVTNDAWLSNLSARAYVAPATGAADVLIAGFVVSGPTQKSVLVRGDGPSLSGFGVSGALADPTVGLYTSATTMIGTTTDGWSPGLSSLFSEVGAFPLAAGSKDTALQNDFSPGNYTVIVNSASSQDGVALAELYDADAGAPSTRLVNLSARAYVGTGSNVLIGGFEISGKTSETVLIRAVGPGLASYGLTSGTLAKPILQVFDTGSAEGETAPRLIASIQGWGSAPTPGNSPVAAGVQPATAAAMAQVGAFSLASGSADGAMILTLPPGGYTAEVSGADGGLGVALVEIYEVP
jgi:sugar lactone lactonase YvrE